MDVGTAVEMGFMYARGRPVFGYTNISSDYAARVQDDGMAVEAFSFVDNLMCEGVVRRSGGRVVRGSVSSGDLMGDLQAFERCIVQAAESSVVCKLRHGIAPN